MQAEVQFEEDPEDVPSESRALEVVRRYTPPPGDAVTRCSNALRCPRCRATTWVLADEARPHCRACRFVFYFLAGKYFDRAGYLSAKKAATPKE